MATLFILIGLLPSLLCELPAIPIELSKETTFIIEPLAGDGLPNYALAIQKLEKKGVTPEQNGAIPFWQGMGQCEMSDEEFERLAREIGLSFDSKVKPFVPLQDKATFQAIIEWLRETGRSSDEEELSTLADDYVAWVQSNPWTAKDVPPLAKWLADNDQALDLFVESSNMPQFYSPYPNLLVDRTVSVLEVQLQHVSGMRRVTQALMARAMYRVGKKDHQRAWYDCRSCIALGNHLASEHMLVNQLVAMSARRNGLGGTCVLLSQSNISSKLASLVFNDLIELNRPVDCSTALDHGERLMALDIVLRMSTGHLEDQALEEIDKDLAKIVKAGIDPNLSLRWINERYDRMVKSARIPNHKERVRTLGALADELEEEAEELTSMARLGGLSRTFRSNVVAEICFIHVFPALEMMGKTITEHEQFSMLTTIAAALAVHKAEHGHSPKELAELSPAILKDIPDDLYTDKPLHYKLTDDGYLLYSLFENETEDGGTDVEGEIRDGEWQDDNQEVEREKCDLVIRMPVVPRSKP
jgi:hypothetical protein